MQVHVLLQSEFSTERYLMFPFQIPASSPFRKLMR
jgi:hypothetical protein